MPCPHASSVTNNAILDQQTILDLAYPTTLDYKGSMDTVILKPLTTVPAVMEVLGGTTRGKNKRIGELTGRTHKAVHNWWSFKTFPADTYLVMTQALAQKGYSAPASLWSQVEPAEAVE